MDAPAPVPALDPAFHAPSLHPSSPDAPLAALRAAVPPDGLFAGKSWRFSPQPFHLSAPLLDSLRQLGDRLWLFQKACNDLYALSASGRQPAWIAELLDLGKPPELIAFSRQKCFRHDLPRVLRPDLILTPEGFVVSELDSIPGGIGLTAWLTETYAKQGFRTVGSAAAIEQHFAALAPGGDILVSREAETYRPEMEWLAARTGQRVCDAEGYASRPDVRAHAYRFFELFDLPNIPGIPALQEATLGGALALTPPFKPQLEEKLWFALFWLRPLRDFWRRALGDKIVHALQRVLPRTWVLDPQPLPPHAEVPELGIHSFEELEGFSQKERELVIKASGFSERAWGARSVVIGSDQPQGVWSDAVRQALAHFGTSPHILQRFHKARVFGHNVYEASSGEVLPFPCKVRLCPYYFVTGDKPELCGALATLCPPDKKILHGMSDAVLLPAALPA